MDKVMALSASKHMEMLYRYGTLCDVVISVGKKEFRAHRSHLACYSIYFHSMFVQDDLEDSVILEDVSPDAFQAFLQLIYTHKLVIRKPMINDLIKLAQVITSPIVLQKCMEFLKTRKHKKKSKSKNSLDSETQKSSEISSLVIDCSSESDDETLDNIKQESDDDDPVVKKETSEENQSPPSPESSSLKITNVASIVKTELSNINQAYPTLSRQISSPQSLLSISPQSSLDLAEVQHGLVKPLPSHVSTHSAILGCSNQLETSNSVVNSSDHPKSLIEIPGSSHPLSLLNTTVASPDSFVNSSEHQSSGRDIPGSSFPQSSLARTAVKRPALARYWGPIKKPRTMYTEFQTQTLNDFFRRNAFPSRPEMGQLSSLTGLHHNQLKTWFQNTRQRARKAGINIDIVLGEKVSTPEGADLFMCKKCDNMKFATKNKFIIHHKLKHSHEMSNTSGYHMRIPSSDTLNEYQSKILEYFYDQNPSPSRNDVRAVANNIGTKISIVANWLVQRASNAQSSPASTTADDHPGLRETLPSKLPITDSNDNLSLPSPIVIEPQVKS